MTIKLNWETAHLHVVIKGPDDRMTLFRTLGTHVHVGFGQHTLHIQNLECQNYLWYYFNHILVNYF